MDMIFQKTRELGEALLESEVYKRMKAAEDKAMHNQEAAQLMSDMLERRSNIQEMMHSPDPDPAVLKRLSDEMDEFDIGNIFPFCFQFTIKVQCLFFSHRP